MEGNGSQDYILPNINKRFIEGPNGKTNEAEFFLSDTQKNEAVTNEKTNEKNPLKNQVGRRADVRPGGYHHRTKIDFRVSSLTKERYMELSPQQKKIVKMILEAVILTMAGDKDNLEKIARDLGVELMRDNIPPTIFNINVNYSEATKTKIDLQKVIEKLNELDHLLFLIQKYSWDKTKNAYCIPIARMKELIELIEELKKLLG